MNNRIAFTLHLDQSMSPKIPPKCYTSLLKINLVLTSISPRKPLSLLPHDVYHPVQHSIKRTLNFHVFRHSFPLHLNQDKSINSWLMSPHFSLGQGKSELNFNFPLSHFSISRVMLNNDRSGVFKSSQTVHFSCDLMNDFTLSTRRVLWCWKKKIENVCLSLRWAGTKHRAERTVGQLNNVFLSLMIKWSCWRNVEERAEPKEKQI
jgi:hypothetical protein